MKNKHGNRRRFLTGGLTVLTSLCLALGGLTACAGKTPVDDGPQGGQDPVYTISLDTTEYGLELLSDYSLNATLFKDGEQTSETWAADWKSSDESVVTVNSSGQIYGVGVGTATITVSYGSASDTCAVTVAASYTPVLIVGAGTSVSSPISVSYGNEFELVPYVTYNGTTVSDATFAYSTQSSAVAVSDGGVITGVALTDDEPAEVTVTASWANWGAETISQKVYVSVTENVGLAVNEGYTVTLASTTASDSLSDYDVPNSATLTAAVTESGAGVASPSVTWTSENEAVATVSADGVVTGVSEGVTSVYYTYVSAGGGKSYSSPSVTVTVEYPALDRTDSVDLGDIEASAASGSGVTVSAESVFGSALAITQIYDVTDATVEVASEQSGNNVTVKDTLTVGERVWEVRNELYAYRVKVLVVTKIITTFDELNAMISKVAGSGVTYGEGAYYILGNNIDAENQAITNSTSGVTYDATEHGFMGTFDGRGYTISNLYVMRGFFGGLGSTSVVKNFGLTNLQFKSGSNLCALALVVNGGATVENVFIEIGGLENSANTAVGAFVYTKNSSATFKDVVIVDSTSGGLAGSIAQQITASLPAFLDNVHVFSSAPLVSTNALKAQAGSTVYRYDPSLTDGAEEGSAVQYSSVASHYADAEDYVAAAGLNGETWSYNELLGCFVFKTADADEIYSRMVAAVIEAFEALQNSVIFTVNAGETASYTFSTDLGTIAVTANDVDPDYYTYADGTLAVTETAPAGTYSFTVTSTQYKDGDDYFTATVSFVVQLAAAEISGLQELSIDAADDTDYVTLAYEGFTADTTASVSYKANGTTSYTEVDSADVTFADGTLTLSAELLGSLTVAGEYSFRVETATTAIEFSNVFVYTDVITSYTELLAVFYVNGAWVYGAKTYGENTYYILGDNIDASGKTITSSSGQTTAATAYGFSGTFDGRGYTISNLTVARGLFGNIYSTGVVKNLGLAHLSLTNAGNACALACTIAAGAVIENVYVEIDSSSSATSYGLMLTAAATTTTSAPTFTNVVVVDHTAEEGSTQSLIGSLGQKINTSIRAIMVNVHVFSSASLQSDTATSFSLLTQESAVYRYNASLTDGDKEGAESSSGSVSYVAAVQYASVASHYADAEDYVAAAGLDANYWTYDVESGYFVFASAADLA